MDSTAGNGEGAATKVGLMREQRALVAGEEAPKVGLMREQRARAREEPPKVGLMREQRARAGEESGATKGGSQCSWGGGR